MAKYTYIGGGEDAPQMTNFMGLQEFIIGEETEVTNQTVLAKIRSNPTFVEGTVERKKIFTDAKQAKEKADAQRTDDKIVDAREKKRRK